MEITKKIYKNHLGVVETEMDNKWDLNYGNIAYIPKGGKTLAEDLAKTFNLPIIPIKEATVEKTLIVDDLIDSGDTIMPYLIQGFNCVSLIVKKAGFDRVKKYIKSESLIYSLKAKDEWINFFWEKGEDKGIKANITRLLQFIGEDPKREGLVATPDRVERAYGEMFSGYKTDFDKLMTVFDSEGYDQMIVVKDIDYWSHCEHHMVPFFGRVHIGYIPNKKIIGLSKFGRIVEGFARRLQVQERLTTQIADIIEEKLKPLGLIVVVEGTHLCMVMRGVKKINSSTITSDVRGVLSEDPTTRDEFFNIIK